jgi:DNA-binding NarL/FixJ family response regulator
LVVLFEYPLNVVLADAHSLYRDHLRRILEERPGFQVVGEARDGVELLNLLKRVTPNLAIMDIMLPASSGIKTIRQIKAGYPEVKIIVLTMRRDPEYVNFALNSGANGYLLKSDDPDYLFAAIQTINKGEFFCSPLLDIKNEIPRTGTTKF